MKDINRSKTLKKTTGELKESEKMATVQSPPEINLASSLPVQQENDLDLVALTMAALRLVNPWSVDTSNKWSQRIEPGTPEAKDRVITLAEVSQHDTPKDCWVVIYDRVYDITDFLDEVSNTFFCYLFSPFMIDIV